MSEQDGTERRFILIDTTGRLVKDMGRYQSAFFGEHTIVFQTADEADSQPSERYLVTDSDGNEVAVYDEIILEEADYYSEDDMIAVRQGGRWGLADKNYRLLVPCRYRTADGYGCGPGAIVTLDDGSVRYIDRRDRTLLKTEGLSYVRPMRNGIYWVSLASGSSGMSWFGLMDSRGCSTFDKKDLAAAKRDCIAIIESQKSSAQKAAEPVLERSQPVAAGSVADDSVVFVVVEEMPQFPGGLDSMYAFLVANVRYPEAARNDSIQGVVYVSFVVERDGTVSTIRLLHDIGGGCGQEAVRVVGMMLRWTPGKQGGKPVRTQFNLPLKFSL